MRPRLLMVILLLVTGCEALEIRGSNRPPPTLTCYEHLLACLETPISAVPGNYGASVCSDCYNLCLGDPFRTWPWVTGSLKSCRWWDYRDNWVTSPDASPEEESHGY
jgi:hypothetical protein